MSSIKFVLIVAVTAAVAVSLAFFASRVLQKTTSERRALALQIGTAEVIAKMNSVMVGTRLPDATFLQQDSSNVQLSDLISEFTFVSFVDAACDACLKEMEAVSELSMSAQGNFVFVSTDDLVVLAQVKNSLGLSSAVVQDVHGEYTKRLAVAVYPLVCIVDKDMRVRHIVAASLNAGELKELLRRFDIEN